jgi:hypothetical protein
VDCEGAVPGIILLGRGATLEPAILTGAVARAETEPSAAGGIEGSAVNEVDAVIPVAVVEEEAAVVVVGC